MFRKLTVVALALAGSVVKPIEGAVIEYDSAVMNSPAYPGGLSVSTKQFAAWRFQVDQNVFVNEVGGHLGQIGSGRLFAALVKIESLTALPPAPPFSDGALLASTTFSAPASSDDVTVPLTAQLAPGTYALVFGAGLFGPAGESAVWATGYMPQPTTQSLVPPVEASSFLLWINSTSPHWRDKIGSNLRFVVRGNTYAGPGDFNLDGAINGSDLAVWRGHFGGAGSMTVADGDANGDGAVGGVDFLTWQRSQGQPAAAVAAVPEPNSGWVALTIAVMLQLRRWRRRQ